MKTDFSWQGRNGLVMQTVLFVFIVFSALALQLYRLSLQAQASSFRFEQSDSIRRIAEAAMAKSFIFLDKQLKNPQSPTGAWLIQASKTPFSVPSYVFADIMKTLVPAGYSLELKATATIVQSDLRTKDGTSNSAFYEREALGSLELVIDAVFYRSAFLGRGKRVAGCRLARYHDYKIVAISTRSFPTGRNGYAGAFALHYALLVRNGFTEFHETLGRSINNGRVLTIVNPPKVACRGKVFLGGTPRNIAPGTQKGPMFLNLPESFYKIMPPFSRKSEVPQLALDDCVTLYPALASVPYYRDFYANLRGIFTISHETIGKSPPQGDKIREVEESVKNGLSRQNPGPEGNMEPGLGLFSPSELEQSSFLQSVMEGDLRQRFLYFVRFNFDWTACSPSADARILSEAAVFPCFPRTDPPTDSKVESFYRGLKEMNEKYAPPGPSLYSSGNASFPFDTPPPGFQGNIAHEPSYSRDFVYFSGKGNEKLVNEPENPEFQPFRHYVLWFRSPHDPSGLEKYGIYDKKTGVLNLRGIVWVTNGTVDLAGPEDKPLKIIGQGMLVAPKFHIRSGLVKNSEKDLCILYAYGKEFPIVISTSQKIEASLMAVNSGKTGKIAFGQGAGPLNLKGALIVDRLDSQNWPNAPHSIVYDPILKSDEDTYCINLSPWVTFQRIAESES